MKLYFKFLPITFIFLVSIICAYFFTGGLLFTIIILFLIFLFLSIQFFGAYLIGLNFHVDSINSIKTTQKKVMLTFDDGPHKLYTQATLEVLQKHEVKALFFLIGKNIEGNESVVNEIIKQNHSIGNHSFSHHFWFDIWSTKKVTNDIVQCQTILKDFQLTTNLFRPPYGVTNPNIAKALKKTQLQSVGWNIRSYDTSIKDIEKINERILKKLKPGAIILLHDRLEFMPQLLEKLIPAIKQKGYEFTTDFC